LHTLSLLLHGAYVIKVDVHVRRVLRPQLFLRALLTDFGFALRVNRVSHDLFDALVLGKGNATIGAHDMFFDLLARVDACHRFTVSCLPCKHSTITLQ